MAVSAGSDVSGFVARMHVSCARLLPHRRIAHRPSVGGRLRTFRVHPRLSAGECGAWPGAVKAWTGIVSRKQHHRPTSNPQPYPRCPKPNQTSCLAGMPRPENQAILPPRDLGGPNGGERIKIAQERLIGDLLGGGQAILSSPPILGIPQCPETHGSTSCSLPMAVVQQPTKT